MRATVMRDWQLRVDDLADPTPGPGQVLAKVLACGI
jgi:NADPH:quinone reductase-like Zn-dependent oxidoreductase